MDNQEKQSGGCNQEQDLSDFSRFIEKRYSGSGHVGYSLSELTDHLAQRLKENKEGLELYKDLDSSQRDAAGVLVESGEVMVYRNDNNRVCIKYRQPSFVKRILAL